MRKWDCEAYPNCLGEAAHADSEFTCDGCQKYAKIESSELVTPGDLFGCLLLRLAVSYPGFNKKQGREVLDLIAEDLLTHTEFPKINFRTRGRPVSQWRMTPTAPPSWIPPWYKKKRD